MLWLVIAASPPHETDATRIAAPANAAFVLGAMRLSRALACAFTSSFWVELVDRVGQLVTLGLDLGLELLRGGDGSSAGFPFTVAMSSFTPSIARSGLGGDAWATFFLPASATMPPAASSTTATMRAASQAGRTRSRARIAVAIRTATPKKASRPAALNMPMPEPGALALLGRPRPGPVGARSG